MIRTASETGLLRVNHLRVQSVLVGDSPRNGASSRIGKKRKAGEEMDEDEEEGVENIQMV